MSRQCNISCRNRKKIFFLSNSVKPLLNFITGTIRRPAPSEKNTGYIDTRQSRNPFSASIRKRFHKAPQRRVTP